MTQKVRVGVISVPVGLGSVKSVSTGYFHTCAIKADDSVKCWGKDNLILVITSLSISLIPALVNSLDWITIRNQRLGQSSNVLQL